MRRVSRYLQLGTGPRRSPSACAGVFGKCRTAIASLKLPLAKAAWDFFTKHLTTLYTLLM